MMKLKTAKDIAIMREGGKLLAQILAETAKMVRPGVTTEELDTFAERRIYEVGGAPAFKGYKPEYAMSPFPSTLCTSINSEVVHAPAFPARVLKKGDILSLDIGMRYPAEKGLFTDMAVTVPVGKVSPEAERLIAVTREALSRAVKAVKKGASIADIGRAVQNYAESNGFGVVRQLVGHGVGYKVHEDPCIPNYFDLKLVKVPISLNLPLAIEPMITAGNYHIVTANNGWTAITLDKSLAAHFEATVVLTKNGVEILTPILI